MEVKVADIWQNKTFTDMFFSFSSIMNYLQTQIHAVEVRVQTGFTASRDVSEKARVFMFL